MHGGGSVGFFSRGNGGEKEEAAPYLHLYDLLWRVISKASRVHTRPRRRAKTFTTTKHFEAHVRLYFPGAYCDSTALKLRAGKTTRFTHGSKFLFFGYKCIFSDSIFKESCTNRKKRLNSKQTRVGGEFVFFLEFPAAWLSQVSCKWGLTSPSVWNVAAWCHTKARAHRSLFPPGGTCQAANDQLTHVHV